MDLNATGTIQDTSPAVVNRPLRGGLWRRAKRYKILYLLLLPELVYFIIFKYIPMFGIIIAFKNYNIGLGFLDSPWVGLTNFKNFVDSVYFWDIMNNTISISLYKLSFGFTASILLALLGIGSRRVPLRWCSPICFGVCPPLKRSSSSRRGGNCSCVGGRV